MLSMRARLGRALLVFSAMTTLSYAAPRGQLREDIEYSRPGGVSLRMDAHIPEGHGPFPAVIIVHGGAWVSGDRRANVHPLFQPLQDAGFAWFSISYRLATDIAQFGAGIVDVEEAVRYVKQHAAEYNIDPDRIALVGESAGAQLASMAALAPGTGVKAVGRPSTARATSRALRRPRPMCRNPSGAR